MTPTDRFVPRYIAEPPQDPPPQGDWAGHLRRELLTAFLDFDELPPQGIGEPGEVRWFPDRTWGGRTYVPATTRTSTGVDLYGVVSYAPAIDDDQSPEHFAAVGDWTIETAEANPEWTIDLCDEVIGGWRGELDEVAAMTLVWGMPIGAARSMLTVTAELGGLTVDRCTVRDGTFTLLAADDYQGSTLEIVGWDAGGNEVARESLYADDESEN